MQEAVGSKMPSLPRISPAFSERHLGTWMLRVLEPNEVAVRIGLGSWVEGDALQRRGGEGTAADRAGEADSG